MPVSYCPQGHRIAHASAITPANCPTCGASTAPKPIVVATVTHAPSAPAAKQPWPKRGESRGLALDELQNDSTPIGDDFSFEGRPEVEIDTDGPLTVKELAQSGEAIERTESRGPALPGGGDGGEHVNTMDLVAEMVRGAAANGELPVAPRAKVASAQPKRARAAAKRATKPKPARVTSGGDVHVGPQGGTS